MNLPVRSPALVSRFLKSNWNISIPWSAPSPERTVCPPHLPDTCGLYHVQRKTLYTYIDNNLLSARNIDLPLKVCLRPRKSKPVALKIDKSCRIGRTWKDYCSYMALHPDTPVVQIDSIEGIKGGKVLHTIYFVNTSLMLAFLRDSNDSQSVIDIFDRIYLELRPGIFKDLFPVILADNGSEFPTPPRLNLTIRGTAGHICSTVLLRPFCPPIKKEQRRTTMNLYGVSSQKA